MQTINSILLAVRQEKTCSEVQLRRYIRALKIQPLGVRQRPQRYPDDSAARILAHLGLGPLNGAGRGESPQARGSRRLVTLPALQKERRK